MNVRREAENWLAFAREDLESAKALLSAERYMHVCFHSQQSIEKGLKALLVLNGLDNPKTHKLLVLIAETEKFYPEIENFREEIKKLDGYYLTTRYPNGVLLTEYPKIFTKYDAEQAIELSERVLQFIEGKFKEEKR